MRRHVIAAVLLLAACSGRGPQAVGSNPSWRGGARVAPVAHPVTFAPSGQAAVRYNEPLRAPPASALGDAVTAAVKEAAALAGTPTPAADARLFRACAELAAIVPEEGVVSYGLVEFALQRNGIIEPSPNLLVIWGEIDSPQVIVEQLQPRLAELLADGATARLGIGAAKRRPDGTGAVVFALQASSVTTQPIPRAVPAGGGFAIDAVVDPRYRDPEVFVTQDDGATARLELKAKARGFVAQVACGKRSGRQQVEITASDAQGSTVLANFPVWCGTEPPLSVTVDPAEDDAPIASGSEAEHRLLALVNRDRQAAGLPALLWDDRVADVARGYSEEMRRTKVVAHISPTSGSAADRVRVAKIKTAVVLENVARAYGVQEAHQALMNSPGHRTNLMSKLATHIGIGLAFGDEISGRREMFITQVFTRVPPKIDPARASDAILAKLGEVRAVGNSAQLAAIARQLVDQLAAGKTREQAYPAIKKQIDALGGTYSRVGSVITTVIDLDGLDARSILDNTKVDDVGIAVGQGNHPELGENAIWVVVLIAEKRVAKPAPRS